MEKNAIITAAENSNRFAPFTYRFYRACTSLDDDFLEFSVDYSDADVIIGCYIGGKDSMPMVGHAFNEEFSKRFINFMETEIKNFGVANMFWEEFYAIPIKDLTPYLKEFEKDDIIEFEDIDELRQFDSDFLLNVDSEIIENICPV